MGKGSSQANQTFNSSMAGNNMMQGNAGNAWNAAFPVLQQNATNPTGFTPGQLASMNTANQQGMGGSMAGAVGQANLEAGRTRNAGGFGAALDQSARNAGSAESKNAIGIQDMNANLAQQKQQDALKTLGSLYGTNVSGMNGMLDNANKATQNIIAGDQATVGDIMGGVGKLASMGSGGMGNLDQTGTSSGGDQMLNFMGGL